MAEIEEIEKIEKKEEPEEEKAPPQILLSSEDRNDYLKHDKISTVFFRQFIITAAVILILLIVNIFLKGTLDDFTDTFRKMTNAPVEGFIEKIAERAAELFDNFNL